MKNTAHGLRGVLALLAVFCFEKEAGAQASKQYASVIATSRAAIQAMMQSSQTPAVSVAMAMSGEIVWSEAFGFADIEQKRRATTETRFGLGSVTKSFTGVLAARLLEEGKLDLDAPVENYLPQFPHKNKNISARLLIAHLSGLNDEYNNSHYYEKRHLTTSAALDEILRTNTLAYAPRTRHEYTTSNYTIVAAMIEQASGKDFATAMRHYVLQPLGLQRTSFNDRTHPLADAATFYVKDGHRVIKAPEYDPSFKWAGAGLLANAEDVARYGSALLREGFLKPNTRAEIFRPLKTASGEETNYALGWYIGKDKNGRRIYEHGGGGPGISSYIRLYPQEDCVLAILSNLTNAPVNGDIAPIMAEAFLQTKERKQAQ